VRRRPMGLACEHAVAGSDGRVGTWASFLRRIALLCRFVGSAAGSRCSAARGYKKEIEWVLERDGWSTYGILT
jgi:hypothetical protein